MKTEIVTLVMCGTLVFALLTLFWGGALLERRLNHNIKEHFDPPATKVTSYTGLLVRPCPPILWVWHVFGRTTELNGTLCTVHLPFPVPLWRRIITRILLGSVWEKCK